MAKKIIPIRPNLDNSPLKDIEKDALSYYVLFGVAKEQIFARFLHPEMQMSKVALKRATEMFFADKDVIKYIEDYQNTIDKFLDFECFRLKLKDDS